MDGGITWPASSAGMAAAWEIQRLMEALMVSWPRRGRRLLVIGADPGIHCRFFWSCGFDVILAAPDPRVLAEARQSLGDAADVHLAQPDHLPWEEDAVDYALVLFAMTPKNRQAVVTEAVRVARSGVMLVFGDTLALARPLTPSLPQTGPWWGLRRLLRLVHPAGRIRSASVVPGLKLPWGASTPLLPPGIGPCCGILHDFSPTPTTTPLWAWRHGVEIS
ncbi:MAG: hypothetical protein PWQ64_769 [Desulfomicrobiaceae bacterium]|nr:hypothetical protein [Desulfomicrobiaceae bacterium]